MGPSDRENLDHWLDAALRQLGSAEPRSGLESRILENMAVGAHRTRISRPRLWGVAMASAAVLVIAIWLGTVHRGTREPEKSAEHASSAAAGNDRVQQVMPQPTTQEPVTKHLQLRRAHEMRTAAAGRDPRLDQFPSARSLSQEELQFANYAEHFPKQATLIAKEQQNFEEEIRQAEREALDGDAVSNQER